MHSIDLRAVHHWQPLFRSFHAHILQRPPEKTPQQFRSKTLPFYTQTKNSNHLIIDLFHWLHRRPGPGYRSRKCHSLPGFNHNHGGERSTGAQRIEIQDSTWIIFLLAQSYLRRSYCTRLCHAVMAYITCMKPLRIPAEHSKLQQYLNYGLTTSKSCAATSRRRRALNPRHLEVIQNSIVSYVFGTSPNIYPRSHSSYSNSLRCLLFVLPPSLALYGWWRKIESRAPASSQRFQNQLLDYSQQQLVRASACLVGAETMWLKSNKITEVWGHYCIYLAGLRTRYVKNFQEPLHRMGVRARSVLISEGRAG